MKQFVYGALVATAVLGAAGFAVMKEPVAGARRNVPLAVGDLTLDRAVRCQTQITPSQPWIVTMPTTCGFAMTSLKFGEFHAPYGIFRVDISVGGCVETYDVTEVAGSSVKPAEIRFDPPLVVAPGATLSVAHGGQFQHPSNFATFVVGGYVVYPGEV
jgi:hypothetical protein